MTLFDNGPTEKVASSRGLLLDVNQNDMTVKLVQDFINGAKTWAQFEGNLQAIDLSNENTNLFIGYGSQPYFAELNANGDVLLDVQFGKPNAVNSYRAYKLPWQGKPLNKPDVHWDKNGNRAYFSWNSQTDCENWVVYTANAANSSTWTNVTAVHRTGFETIVDLMDVQLDAYVRGKAINGPGSVLGRTQASDGNQLFDSPDDIQENASTSPTAASSTTSSSSGTSAAASSSTSTGAAAKVTQSVKEQVYLAAVIIAGGLALI
ncbi:uncharacterized protein EKO05_0002275 [Ascochyta rabiei]|uniref:uncharacterized protein n=1 Tax=Didymella rabiei TaxID=5454 RepID=UPI0022051420|nr:uncharacterized protein EKO05_0002275 [Ascochyta rabiei]UPX11681.1 hypothetical protein EKO05_0002275 [Ascochyta rabiei]